MRTGGCGIVPVHLWWLGLRVVMSRRHVHSVDVTVERPTVRDLTPFEDVRAQNVS
jgi:hypothetical protein